MENVTQKPVGVSSYDWSTGETTYDVTQMDPAQRFRCAISQAVEAARKRFPHSSDRIERAYALVTEGKVVLHPQTKTATVTSSDGAKSYTVTGHCDCPDAPRAPEQFCKHRLAVVILKKAVGMVHEWKEANAPVTVQAEAMAVEEVEAEPVAAEPVVVVEAEVIPSAPRIPREFLYDRKGIMAIRWGGLLHMAHAAGLHSTQVEVVTVTPDFAVMRATVRFNDGGEWTDIGDATPQNVGKDMAHAFIRMASTRAMARCLRWALNVPYVCAVELQDE